LYNYIGYFAGKITVKFCQKGSPLPSWKRVRVRGSKTFLFHPHLASSPIKGEENFRDIYYKKIIIPFPLFWNGTLPLSIYFPLSWKDPKILGIH
jgi:hypothetical protein